MPGRHGAEDRGRGRIALKRALGLVFNVKITRQEAFDILTRCRMMHGVDFGSLSKTQIEALLAEADQLKYPRRKPGRAIFTPTCAV